MKFSTACTVSLGMLLAVIAGWCLLQAQLPARANQAASAQTLLHLTVQREKLLHRVNAQPHVVSATVKAATNEPGYTFNCEPLGNSGARGADPHADFSVVVYLTINGREIMDSGQGNYPANTVILKEKLVQTQHCQLVAAAAPSGSVLPQPQTFTQLFTGMLKREPGYNPECGDWEFFIVSGDAKQLIERGKIDSCIACHQDYKQTDFVTRAYMPAEIQHSPSSCDQLEDR